MQLTSHIPEVIDMATEMCGFAALIVLTNTLIGVQTIDVRETFQLRRSLKQLLQGELDKPNRNLTSLLVDQYVITLQTLSMYHFRRNPYAVNSTKPASAFFTFSGQQNGYLPLCSQKEVGILTVFEVYIFSKSSLAILEMTMNG